MASGAALLLATTHRWFEKRRKALEGVGSTLEFQLARLRFLRFLEVGAVAAELWPNSGGMRRGVKATFASSTVWGAGNRRGSFVVHMLDNRRVFVAPADNPFVFYMSFKAGKTKPALNTSRRPVSARRLPDFALPLFLREIPISPFRI